MGTEPACLEFDPQHFHQLAGLIYYYNAAKVHYLYISRDESSGRYVRVMSYLPDLGWTEDVTPAFPVPDGAVELRAEVDCERLRFGYRPAGEDWRWVPMVFDASIVSDEAGPPAFFGLYGCVCRPLVPGPGRNAPFRRF